MSDLWNKLADAATKKTTALGVLVALITLALVPGLTRLEFATGQDSYLNEGSKVANDNESYQDLFGGQAMLTVFSGRDGATYQDLFTGQNLANLVEAEQRLNELTNDDGTPLLKGVITPLTAVRFSWKLLAGEDGNVLGAPASTALAEARSLNIANGDYLSGSQRLMDTARTGQRLLGGDSPFAELPENVAAALPLVEPQLPEGTGIFDGENADVLGFVLALAGDDPMSTVRDNVVDDTLWADPEGDKGAAYALIEQAGASLLADPSGDGLAVSLRADIQEGPDRDFAEIIGEVPTNGSETLLEVITLDNTNRIRKSLRSFFPTPPDVDPLAENATVAQMIVRLPGNASLEEEDAAAQAVLDVMDEYTWEGFEVRSTGAPVLLGEINDYLQGGMLTLGGIAVVIMAIVLLLIFRVRWRLLPLAVCLIGVLWAFSLLGYLGIALSLVTISGLPILIGMGIDFALQTHARIDEELRTGDAEPFRTTASRLGPPILTAMVAAAVAFLALQISALPMMRDFGVILAIGIVVLASVGLLLPLGALSFAERRSETTQQMDEHPISRAVVKLGSLPQSTVVPFIALGVVLLIAGVILEDRFEIQTDVAKWVDQDSINLADIEWVQEQTGSASELGVFVESENVFDQETIDFATDFIYDMLDTYPAESTGGLLGAASMYSTVAFVTEVPGDDIVLVPPSPEVMEAVYALAPDAIKASTINLDSGLEGRPSQSANLIFRAGDSELEVRATQVDGAEEMIDAATEGSAIAATPSGLAVVGVGLLENLLSNRAILTYAALAAVAVWLMIRFRSPGKVLLSLVPVLVAVGLASIVVALFNIKLSPLTTVSGPLVIATCTEFSALIIARYVEERESGLSPNESSDVAASRTGLAFVASALTTIGGFAVLIGSALPLLRDFGAIVALNVGVALLSALVVLPPMLKWADEKGLLALGSRGSIDLTDQGGTADSSSADSVAEGSTSG